MGRPGRRRTPRPAGPAAPGIGSARLRSRMSIRVRGKPPSARWRSMTMSGSTAVDTLKAASSGRATRDRSAGQATDLVVEPALHGQLVPGVAAGPDPVVGNEVAHPERQADGDEVRDQVVDPEPFGGDQQDGHAHRQRGDVQGVEGEVANEQMPPRIATPEHPELGEDEVVEGRHLRGQDGRDGVVDAQDLGEEDEGDRVDADADDADDCEPRWAEQRSEHGPSARLPVATHGSLSVG